MGLPESNARLVGIAGGGSAEDYDVPAGADAEKWAGDADAYLVEKVLSQPGRSADGTGARDVLRQDYLVIEHSLSAIPEIGDSLSFVQDGVEHTREVRQIERHKIAGTARFYLTDE